MNFQDVIRNVYDAGNNVLRTSATLTGAAGQVTVSPQQAWPDPKTYIGLVTVTGNLSASLGGNITLNPSSNFIGIVTVANSAAGTQYTEGDTDSSITGNAILWEDTSDTLRSVSVSKPLPVQESGQLLEDIQDNIFGLTAHTNRVARFSLIKNRVLASPQTVSGNSTMAYDGDDTVYFYIPATTNSQIYSYNIRSGVTTALTNGSTLAEAYAGAAMIYVNDKLYFTRGGGYKTFYSINADGSGFTTLTSTASDINFGCAMAWNGGDYIYLINATPAFERYSISGNSWSTMDIPDTTGTEGLSLTFAGQDKIYSMQGAGATGFAVYDVSDNAWTSKTATPANVYDGGALAWNGDQYLYAFGGNGSQYLWRYDLIANSWTSLDELPVPASTGSTILPLSNGMFICYIAEPSSITAFGAVNNLYVYDPSRERAAITTDFEGVINTAIPSKIVLDGMSDGTNLQPLRSALGDGVSPWLVLETAVAAYNGSSIDRMTGTTANGLDVDVTRVQGTVSILGVVTVANPSSFSGNITLDSGSRTGIVGNVTISDSKGYIGLVTSTVGNIVSVTPTSNVTLNASAAFIGIVTVTNKDRSITGNVTLTDSKGYIGLTTTTLGASPAFIGIVTVANPSSFSGNITLDAGSKTGVVGNITLSDPKGFIGLVTLGGGVAWVDPKTYIGLVTATLSGSVNTGMTTIFPGPNQIGSVTVSNQISSNIVGNITLSDSKGFIGLVTTTIGAGLLGTVDVVNTVGGIDTSWPDPHTFIGLVTAVGNFTTTFSGNVTLDAGSKTGIVGNLTLSDPKGFIGLVTTVLGNTSVPVYGKYYPALQSNASGMLAPLATDATGRILLGESSGTVIGDVRDAGSSGVLLQQESSGSYGLKVTHYSNVTLSTSPNFIGLITSWSRNAGTTKTLIPLPIAMSTGSVATVAVPTNAQKINVTNIVLNSDATVRMAIKSGVTYLTGNASIGVTLNPGGGFVLTGSPDSPSWIGLPSGALVIEKLDMTGTVAKIGGTVIYFDE